MGIQMMGSQGNGQQSQFQPLARQSSLYNLTLDEVQNQLGDLGKPLSSMNLDELLKNVWSVEVNPVMGMDTENSALPGPVSSASGLHRQGSMTLTQALSKKTVDEVWRDIQQGQSKGREERREKERQPTLGEMTLEDFLMKAGIVAEERKKKGVGDPQNLEGISNVGSVLGADPMVGPQNFPQHPPWMQQYQLPLLHQQQHQQPQHQQQNMMGTYMAGRPVSQPLGIGGGAGPLLDVAYPENQMGLSSPLMGTLSDTQTPGRKRVAPGDVVEKTVERRQKRMIKNRESAARSRARKQAYTNELENKVSRLEEENERLKKQKEVETILRCAPTPEPKYQLRRTSSAPF
ncbi:ABSCISIC ACID-INSENSITIVE 5-like protein 2 isoform X2 [Magnolia sinica]|uniref:ABSCISIC ACID-INSENSITIVE 5-like protein 2 isoform X2 n=1 Tax=Magnolia sinica TaxID=86752 RepID=UPI002659045B|nr:ABSCISIC ACID-INSENSITIVE 5-like protein 2 isoform X2 [Magnolia sinica]